MKQLRALKGHTYASKFQKPGDTYDARDSDANLMVLLKNSEYFTPEIAVEVPKVVPKTEASAERVKRPYVKRNLQADNPAGYSTKDLKAE